MKDYITVIGGGLAGCEAAYQIAKVGIKVKLYEMKPVKFSEAHYPAAKLPFWGFIFLGFMAAAVNWVKEIFEKNGKKGGEEL